MNDETFGALKRILEEVKETRKADCLMKDCEELKQLSHEIMAIRL